MIGRVLDLRPDCLSAPVRFDLVALEAIMLWPKDDEARNEGEETATVAAGLETAKLLEAEALQELAQFAAAAMPLSQIHKRTTVMKGGPFVQGLISGEILFLSLKRTSCGSVHA